MQDFGMEGVGKINGGSFNNITIEGVGTCTDNIKAECMHIKGVFNCSGDVEAGYLFCGGVADFRSNIRAKKINVEGVLNEKLGTKMEAEEIICEGVIKTEGEISADILTADGCVSANEIVGDRIIIRSHYKAYKLMQFFSRFKSVINLIEASTIELRGVNAATVNGKDITIGPDCVIDNVDCSGVLSIDKSAVVRNITGNYTMK